MPETDLLLITGRSLKQGTGLNAGKASPEYLEATTTVELSGSDMASLGLADGDSVRLWCTHGETVVRCRRADLPGGMAFLAYGPPTGCLMGCETHASGMPDSKALPVRAAPYKEGADHAR
jgi:formylmethanofuran dehydrogenase subunit D